MPGSKYLGEFEIVVLAAIIRLREDAYGVSIVDEIKACGGRVVSIGALYATLARLEQKGFVASRKGEATATRGGRAKTFFSVTRDGQAQLNKSNTLFNNMLRGFSGWQPEPTS